MSGCGSSGSQSDDSESDPNNLNFSIKLINEATGNSTDAISDGNPGILQITVTFDSGKPAAGKLVTATPTKGSFSVSADGTDSTDANGLAEIKLVAVNDLGESVTGAGEISVQSGDYTTEIPFAFQIGVPDSTRLGAFIDGVFQGGLLSSSLVSGETLSYGGTALIVADLLDGEGNTFEQPATVRFASQCGATLTESVVTENGRAVCVYTSNGCSSTNDVVTATVLKGGTDLTAMVAVPLAQEATGSIEFVSVDPPNIAVAGTATVTKPENSLITFRVKDDKGNVIAREMVFFSLTTTTGGITVSPLSRETDENGEVTAIVKSGTVATSVRVKALAKGTTISTLSGNISIEETPLSESIGSISLSSGSVIIPADGESQVNLRATVLDKFGMPMPAVDVNFLTTLGTLSTATAWTRSDGIAELQLRSTSSGIALVTANAHGFLTNLQINFTPGNLMNVALQPAVTNNGTIETGESIDFRAILRDSRGNPVPNEQINFAFSDNGNNSGASLSANAGITNDSGIALVNYIAGARPGVDWLEATLNSNNSISNTASMEVIQKTVIVGSMTINANPEEIQADGASSSAITVNIKDISGSPVPFGTEVRFSTTRGIFSNGGTILTMETNDDSGNLTVSLISSLIPGDARVVAVSGGVSQSVTVTFSTTVEPIVGNISLTAAPTVIPADGTSSSTITAVISDTTGTPVPRGQSVIFTTNLGTFADGSTRYELTTADDTGRVVTVIKAGSIPGDAKVSTLSGGVSQSVTVTFSDNQNPDVGKLVIEAAADTLPADGSSSTAITVTVSDLENMPMPTGTPVTLTTTLGTFPGGIDPDGAGPISSRRIFSISGTNGQVMTSLIAPLSEAGTAVITATSGGVSQLLEITITVNGNGEVSLVASPTSIIADGTSTATFTATVKDSGGNPVAGVPVVFKNLTGRDLTTVETNTFEGTISTDTSFFTHSGGTLTLTMTHTGSSNFIVWLYDNNGNTVDLLKNTIGSITDETTLKQGLPAGEYYLSIQADGNWSINLESELGGTVEASAFDELPILITLLTNTTGQATYTHTSTRVAQAVTMGIKTNDVLADASIEQVAGSAASMSVFASPNPMHPGTDTMVTARIVDSNSNPVFGESVNFAVTANNSGGDLSTPSAVTNLSGEASIVYTAGFSNPATDSITVTSGGFSEIADILVDANAIVVGMVTLTSDKNQLPADGGSSAAITVSVFDIDSAPMPSGTPIILTTTLGTFPGGVDPDGAGPITSRLLFNTSSASGQIVISLIAPLSETGTAVITATSGGVSQLLNISITGEPAVGSVSLSADPTAIPADGASSSTVTAVALDVAGTPVPQGTLFNFLTDLGIFSDGSTSIDVATVDDTGTLSVSLIAGDTAGFANVIATVGGVSQQVTVTFTGSSDSVMGTIALSANPDTIPADGVTSTAITATILDISGTAVPEGTLVRFESTLGTFPDDGDGDPLVFTVSTPDDSGVVITSLIADAVPGTAEIKVTSGGVSQLITVVLDGSTIEDAAFLSLSTSQTSIKTDGQDIASITAHVVDAKRVPIEGISVNFETDGGQISASSVITDNQGNATIELSSGSEKNNMQISISAIVQELSAIIPIQLTGSTVTLNVAPTSLKKNDETALTVTVKDAGDIPLYGRDVQISQSGSGSVNLGTSLGKTNVNGVFTTTVQGNTIGNIVLNITALGSAQTLELTVSGEPFEITTPSTELISEKTGQAIEVQVKSPEGHNVKLTTTMGSWTNGTIEGDDGVVSVEGSIVITLSPGANNTVTAEFNTGNPAGMATIRVEDVENSDINDTLSVIISATNEKKIFLQVAPSVIAPSTGDLTNVATLRAMVRNDTNQVVSDAPVMFSIFRTTGGGESINPPIAYTTDAGEAESFFSSGSLGSDSKGVLCMGRISGASVAGPGNEFSFSDANPDTITRSDGGDFTADGFAAGDSITVSGSNSNDDTYTIVGVTSKVITLDPEDELITEEFGTVLVIGTAETTDVVSVRIAQEATSIAIGGATVVEELNPSTYKYPMSILVADSNGNPVPGATVNLSVWPTFYYTGYTTLLGPVRTNEYPNEDINRNDILDVEEESNGHPDGADLTAGNGHIDPLRSTAGTVPSTLITDENGVAQFDYTYLKAYADWLDVEITATTFVSGSETSSALNMSLHGTGSNDSPWGRGINLDPEIGDMTLSANPSVIPADGASSSAITINISDTTGEAMPWGTPVTLTTTLGTFKNGEKSIDVATGNNSGTITVSLISEEDDITGFAEVTAATSGGVTQRVTVTFESSVNPDVEVAAIGMVAAQTALNPNDFTTITSMIYDASGHGIGGQVVEFVLDDPTLGSITASGITASDGIFVANFEAGSSTGTVNVTAYSDSVSSAPLEIVIKDQFVDSIAVSINPTSITFANTASVSALVTDVLTNPVPNATVDFSLQDSAFGTITSSAITNAVGVATVTFIAANFPGTATIIATSGSVSDTEDLDIQVAEAASIAFDSVSANPIAVRGTGGQEFAVITFNVRDINGNPAEDVDVLVTMVSGMHGGEYLEANDDTPYTQVVGTSGGVAEVTVHSGFEAGTVSITASTTTSGGDIISATAPIISIGGGVVTDEWFVVSVGEPGWNLGGLACVGIETNITAWLADRFGNYNVLDGHTVSFQSEVGMAVNPIGVTDGGTGAVTTTIRTQGVPKDVVPETWEMALKTQMSLEFGGLTATGDSLPSGHPRDGVCNVLVFTIGEESFVDGSGGNLVNGVYDVGEVFFDTVDDPWRDYDDDGQWDDGAETTPLTTPGQFDPSSLITVNPEEDEYQDRNGNNQWDGENTFWDGDKNLFRQVDFLITGLPHIRMDKNSFTVANGGFDTVKILVCDKNYNPLSAGSAYTVSVDGGEIIGGVTSYEYPSSSFYGSETSIDWDGGGIGDIDYMLAHRSLIVNEITISDADPDVVEAEDASLSITVTWKSNGGCGDVVETLTIPGTVN